ncbi:unnamed protein product [Prunus armeniaca]
MDEVILVAWFKGGNFPFPRLPGPAAASLSATCVGNHARGEFTIVYGFLYFYQQIAAKKGKEMFSRWSSSKRPAFGQCGKQISI